MKNLLVEEWVNIPEGGKSHLIILSLITFILYSNFESEDKKGDGKGTKG